ncbi:MAG TPA: 2Fe-2S iron-sulfur cluster-binding protein, partial [bacterium]|nr:2Fe-2S iron-sulfur cluster-binding protein [bacterium]
MATVIHRLQRPHSEEGDGLPPAPTCTIDGDLTEFTPDETILEVTRRIGSRHRVPTLCYDPQLEPFGACRVCMVEVEGIPKPVAACHTPVREGMVIRTESEKVCRVRRNVVELLLSDIAEESAHSAHYGRHEFQAIVHQVQADPSKYAGGRRKGDVLAHPHHGQTAPDHVRLDHPYLGLDLAKC